MTGASGFIGGHLTALDAGYDWTCISRRPAPGCQPIGDMADFEGWQDLFHGVDVVVHLAARVHQMDSADKDLYHRDNVEVVEAMARAAELSGVRRFIFLSSIKVNGEETQVTPFRFDDPPAPTDPYGVSKRDAEEFLLEFSNKSSLEVVVIRPPLVYGKGVKANFNKLLGLAKSKLLLPLSLLHNNRDMVSVDNLCDLILCCIESPAAVNNTFLVSDGCSYSTADIIVVARKVQGRKPGLFPVPPLLLMLLLRMLGKGEMAKRLLGSLEVDISHTRRVLSWQPKHTLEDTLRKMAL